MKLNTGLVPLAAAAGFVLLIFACEAPELPANTPVQGASAATATPVPPEARQAALEFGRRHRAIDRDWEQFHRDFDQWRAGLSSCGRSSFEGALRDFASDFNEITVQARNLSRPSGARSIADQLIEAANKEGAALRRLRDRWQPDDTSLFEAVATERAAAAAAQKEAQDRLTDLQGNGKPGSLEGVDQFSKDFEEINADWQKFHENYDSLRKEQGDLTNADTLTRLEELVNQFDDIAAAVDNMPSSSATEKMLKTLKEAADAEGQGLDDLRSALQDTGSGSGEPPAATPAPAGQTPTPEPAKTPAPTNGSTAFDAFDDQVEMGKNALNEVKKDLEAILEDGEARDIVAVQRFAQEQQLLLEKWNRFHQEYDEWRKTEGGCDRAAAMQALSQFTLRFGEITQDVRELPRTSFLRPMGDLLVEAVEREEEAFRVLRNTWRPFGFDVYKALDQERTNAGRLRRQADVGVQELLDRFNISQGEL